MITIQSQADRERASRWVMAAPAGMRVEFKQAKRSDEQNAKLWAMLSEVAAQCPWHGVKLTADDWKFVFIDALKRELRTVPNIDGNGFVNLGRSSSDLSKAEMSDLIELIHAFGAQHDVKFKDDTNSNPSQLPQAETVEPASNPPPVAGAGSPSSELSAAPPGPDNVAARGDESGGSVAPQPTLPQGWEYRLRNALSEARSPGGLINAAQRCFDKLGALPTTRNEIETAKAIRSVFKQHFGDAAAINDALAEKELA
ncbi:recombination protein NinB [Tardiphaga sp.]|uniref:recombination protein NinB n=1 Tax=Tardiphaga sp. TaxID=1926292 RepID=UPI002623DBC6|nr:recombination protein NinB [Tardiphaga sp.]